MRKAVGFVTSEERLNVMFSRVKKRLYVIGSKEHFNIFNENTNMQKFIEIVKYCEENECIIGSKILGRII